MSINQRIKEWVSFKKELGITQAKIAKTFNVKPQYISQLTKKGSVGLTIVKQILDFDKDVSARWLIIGEGNMYENNEVNDKNNSVNEQLIKYLNKKNQDKYIEHLEKEIEELRKQLKMKDEQILFFRDIIKSNKS